MSKLFYDLGGLDDVNLKQAFLTSLPDPLGSETSRLLQTKGRKLDSTTFGEVYQHVLIALEKLCNQQQFFKAMDEKDKLLGNSCARPDLLIKCKDKKCDCRLSSGKSKHFRKWRSKKKSKKFSSFPRRKKWRYFTKKKFRDNRKSDRCYICRKKGHYGK